MFSIKSPRPDFRGQPLIRARVASCNMVGNQSPRCKSADPFRRLALSIPSMTATSTPHLADGREGSAPPRAGCAR
jgi:hypothetical protein